MKREFGHCSLIIAVVELGQYSAYLLQKQKLSMLGRQIMKSCVTKFANICLYLILLQRLL
jgi:hypothetical protein